MWLLVLLCFWLKLFKKRYQELIRKNNTPSKTFSYLRFFGFGRREMRAMNKMIYIFHSVSHQCTASCTTNRVGWVREWGSSLREWEWWGVDAILQQNGIAALLPEGFKCMLHHAYQECSPWIDGSMPRKYHASPWLCCCSVGMQWLRIEGLQCHCAWSD